MNPDVKSRENEAERWDASAVSVGRGERLFVLALSFLAALRVFVFSAAFPFFNNVDEQAHFDLVVKYSRAQVPLGLDPVSSESAHSLAFYCTQEYLKKPEQIPGGRIPSPLWTQPPEVIRQVLQANEAEWRATPNHEASQPPLYYALAGLWLDLGRVLGIQGLPRLYWIRFLNVFFIVALVGLSAAAARRIFPERRWARLGVPLLAAFLPQDTFYSIQNDVLSPVCFGAAFLCLVEWLRPGVPGVRLAALTGLAIAATVLVKASNLPLAAVAAGALAVKVWQLARAGALRAASSNLAWLGACAALPVGAWLVWNRVTFGDFTGSAPKIALLGWTSKPLAEWWHHPLFTLHGLATFWSELMASFWRGEFVWHGQTLASPMADAVYQVSSLLLPGLALLSLVPGITGATAWQRRTLCFCLACLAASVTFLAVLSLAFDFGRCVNPSRAHPFFTSGRLLGGAMIPFLLLYVRGLDWALSRLRQEWAYYLILAGLVLLMTISELVVSRPAFSSQYNWFHLWIRPALEVSQIAPPDPPAAVGARVSESPGLL